MISQPFRRQRQDKASVTINMCTIIIKALKTLKAIHLPRNIYQVHDPLGVNIGTCIQILASPQSMSTTYSSVIPLWLTRTFFNSESERHEEHQYSDDRSVRHIRTMKDLSLVNFVELQLVQ